MIGMPSRNEKRAAGSRPSPAIMPLDIVEPERESPGSTARPCMMPTKPARHTESAGASTGGAARRASDLFAYDEQGRRDEEPDRDPDEVRGHRFDDGLERFRDNAARERAGDDEKHRAAGRRCWSACDGSSEDAIRTMSRQKYAYIASSVAPCKKISNVRSGFTPNHAYASARCPSDDIGRNSVRPCTTPSTTACSMLNG